MQPNKLEDKLKKRPFENSVFFKAFGAYDYKALIGKSLSAQTAKKDGYYEVKSITFCEDD